MLSAGKCLEFKVNITLTFVNTVIENWFWRCKNKSKILF